MISNIELKSLDYDDENFSPVFDRSKKEVFFKPSEKFRTDAQKVGSVFFFSSHDNFNP